MEYQHAWALTGFGDTDSGNEDDSADANTCVEITDGETTVLPDANKAAPVIEQVSPVIEQDPMVVEQVSPVVSEEPDETSGQARRNTTVVQWMTRRSNAVLAAFVLVVCMVAVLITAAWQSAKSPASANAANTSRSSTALGPVLDPSNLGQGPNGLEGSASAPVASGSAQQSTTASGSPSAVAGSSSGAAAGQKNDAPQVPGQTATTSAAYQVASFRIIGLAGKCIGAAGGSSSNGTAIDLYPCRGDATQQWARFSDGTLRTAGKCMEAAGGATADGTRIQLFDCSGAAAQRWDYSAGQDIVNRNADKCLDLKDKSSADFTATQLWTCTGTSNQKWTLG